MKPAWKQKSFDSVMIAFVVQSQSLSLLSLKSFFCLGLYLVVQEPLRCLKGFVQTSSFLYPNYDKQRVTLPLAVQTSTWWNEIITSKKKRILEFLVGANRPFPSCLSVKTSLRAKPIIGKCVPPTGSCSSKSNSFSYKRFRTRTPFWNRGTR